MQTLLQSAPTKRDSLKMEAAKLFRERGFAATGMRHLALACGLEVGSLYSHVKGKSQLLEEICTSTADRFFAKVILSAQAHANASEALRMAMVAHVEVIAEDLNASAVFFHDWRHLDEKDLIVFKDKRSSYEAFFKSLVKRGINEGTFTKGDEKFLTLTIFSALNWTYEWYKPDGELSPTQLGNKLADVILGGLLACKTN